MQQKIVFSLKIVISEAESFIHWVLARYGFKA